MLYLIFLIDDRDVAYVDAIGSVLTAAGCNSNGANVVILDMLAPPATCQTSIVCHEGELKKKTHSSFLLGIFYSRILISIAVLSLKNNDICPKS